MYNSRVRVSIKLKIIAFLMGFELLKWTQLLAKWLNKYLFNKYTKNANYIIHKNKIHNLYLLYNLLIYFIYLLYKLYSLVRLDKTKIFKTWKPRSKYFLYNLIMPALTLAIQSQNQTINQKRLTLLRIFVANASNRNTLWRCAILEYYHLCSFLH